MSPDPDAGVGDTPRVDARKHRRALFGPTVVERPHARDQKTITPRRFRPACMSSKPCATSSRV
ncbi:hypothetical protein RHCRD62_70089 [Rhodococcus sp. RD6.2]|nr:hypothetical protein RHCRD62_70089 [Rhodococcus sp. RD6.2]